MPYGKKLAVTISADNETTLYVELPVTENKSVLSETGASGVFPFYFTGTAFGVVAVLYILYYFKKRNRKDI